MIDQEVLDDIKFFLKDEFKGLSKEYMLDKIRNEEIQKNWKPKVGDIIVGVTGNIFVICGYHRGHEKVGGDKYFFGGGLCSRDGGSFLNETYTNILNEDGLEYYYDFDNDGDNLEIKTRSSHNYSRFSDYFYVPYPHEL